MLKFDDFYAVVTSFEGNRGLPWTMSIDRQPDCVKFVAISDPKVFIAVSAATNGDVHIATHCPEDASTERSAQIIGNQSDYQVESIKEIWQLVRAFFKMPRSLTTTFSWNDQVKIHDDAPSEMNPGEYGWIKTVFENGEHSDRFPEGVVYTVEYENNLLDEQIPESLLRPR